MTQEELEPKNSFMFFTTNKGTKLNNGIYPINDAFPHIFATAHSNIPNHPVSIHFSVKVSRIFGDDYAHISISLTEEDARKLMGEIIDALPTKSLVINMKEE